MGVIFVCTLLVGPSSGYYYYRCVYTAGGAILQVLLLCVHCWLGYLVGVIIVCTLLVGHLVGVIIVCTLLVGPSSGCYYCVYTVGGAI